MKTLTRFYKTCYTSIILILFSQCHPPEASDSGKEYVYRVVIGKTIESIPGSSLDRGYTKYLLAFNDGYTQKTSFGYYTCIKIKDTVLFEKNKGSGWNLWYMKPECN